MRCWTTTRDGQWVECDSGGRPLPDAPLYDRLPPVKAGDELAASDAVRLSAQTIALGQSDASFADRLESAKLALSLVSNNGRRT